MKIRSHALNKLKQLSDNLRFFTGSAQKGVQALAVGGNKESCIGRG